MLRRIFHPVLSIIIIVLLFKAQTASSQIPVTEKTPPSDEARSYSKFRVSIDGGMAYLIGSTSTAKAQMKNYGISDQEADRYYNELKLGVQANASIHYMINPMNGLGLDYSLFTTGSSVLGYLDPGDGWTKFYGLFCEKIYTNYVGASWFQNRKINEKWSYYGKLSVGLVLYRNETRIITAPVLITGSAPAIMGESGIFYSLTRHISVGISLSDFFSSIRKINLNDGNTINEVKLDNDTKENLSRLSLSTGVKFHF